MPPFLVSEVTTMRDCRYIFLDFLERWYFLYCQRTLSLIRFKRSLSSLILFKIIEYHELRVSQCPQCDMIRVRKSLASYEFWNDHIYCIGKNGNILLGSRKYIFWNVIHYVDQLYWRFWINYIIFTSNLRAWNDLHLKS